MFFYTVYAALPSVAYNKIIGEEIVYNFADWKMFTTKALKAYTLYWYRRDTCTRSALMSVVQFKAHPSQIATWAALVFCQSFPERYVGLQDRVGCAVMIMYICACHWLTSSAVGCWPSALSPPSLLQKTGIAFVFTAHVFKAVSVLLPASQTVFAFISDSYASETKASLEGKIHLSYFISTAVEMN